MDAWAAYAAAVWALLFAVANLYWGLGGRFAFPLPDSEALVADPSFVTLNRVAIVGKVLMAVAALSTVQRWGQCFPRRLRLIGVWGLGIGMTIYGLLGCVVDGFRAVGVISMPESTDWTAFYWHLLLWDPYWLVGGALFILAARAFGRRPAASEHAG